MEDKKIERSNKSYAIAVIISGIFGVVGVHHFYLGRILMGLLDFGMFVSFFILMYIINIPSIALIILAIDGLHTIFVTYLLLVGEYKDGDGKIITYPGQKI